MTSEMIWYSVNFLGDLAEWLGNSPVVLMFVGLGILSAVSILVKRLISA